MHVYVSNIEGRPLMPCTPAKAKHLLDAGKAHVVRLTPFKIQLDFECDNEVQEIDLGVDTGSKTLGLSATTEADELYAAEAELRTDITKKLSTRREARRTRRSRLRHRKPRFNNRRRKEGWIPPSIQHKVDTHVSAVADVCTLLPVSHITAEVAQFDIQKKNPDIQGEEYQHGEIEGWNTREYVLARDNHECQHCHGKSGDPVLNVHHIESRQTGGNAPNNLVTLCKTCHQAYHAGEIELDFKRGQKFRDASHMNIMRWKIRDALVEKFGEDMVDITYGYVTKHERIGRGLPKTHAVDARMISGNCDAKGDDVAYRVRKVRRNNRQVHKANTLKGGIKRNNQAAKYVSGFRLFDTVMFDGKQYYISALRTRGSFLLRDLFGNKTERTYKKLSLIQRSTGKITQAYRPAFPIPLIEVGVSTKG